MNHYFDDILQLTDKEPLWYDALGVPRWNNPHPANCSNIYADCVVVAEIECQYCARSFTTMMSSSLTERLLSAHKSGTIMKKLEDLDYNDFYYGDPPAHLCVGDTMSIVETDNVTIWKRVDLEWQKVL